MVKQKNRKKTFYIDVIGCEKRKLDAEKILQYMQKNGYQQITEANKLKEADVVLFVSCAFNTDFSDLSKNKMTELLEKKRDNSTFILSGCLPDIEPDFIEDNGITNFFGPTYLENIDTILDEDVKFNLIPEQNISYFDNIEYPVPDLKYRSPVLEEYVNSKNGFKVRVCWGCLNKCSYCAVRKATKRLKSKPLNEIKNEINKGIITGHKKFFFTGGDVGAYGVDINHNVVSLLDLTTSFRDVDIYIQEFNVQWLIKYADEISNVFLKNQNNYNQVFLNIPIQSGSNNILKLMRRPYKAEEIFDAVEKVRNSNPKIRIGSHFIVGFPGETENDFEKTKRLIGNLDLDFIMVFTYSDHPSAESSKLHNKVSSEISNERREELLELQLKKDIALNKFIKTDCLDFSEIQKLGAEIEGWLTPNEGELLFTLAKQIKSGNVVEIGSWKGKSTYYLACGLIQGRGGKVCCVDHHTGSKEQRARNDDPINTLNEFTDNMRKYNIGHKIQIYVMGSIEASKEIEGNIDLIFVDGSHEYEDVKVDFKLWWPRLNQGGIMAFHDSISKSGVSRLIGEIINYRDDFREPILVDEITYFIKTNSHPEIGKETKKQFLEHKRVMAKKIQKMKTDFLSNV